MVRRWGFVFCLLLCGFFLLIPYLPKNLGDEPDLLLLVGRLHPLVLHFPIVIILLTLLFLLTGNAVALFKHPLLILSMLILGCISSVIAAFAGYLLVATADYSGELVNDHLWGAVLTGLGISLSTALYLYLIPHQSSKQAYLMYGALGATTLILGYTSHLGGTLTHGQEFLSEPLTALFPPKDVVEKPIEEMLLYEDLIHTILDAKCLNCHNENKTKGGLLMTSLENLLKAGESGKAAIVPGNPLESELMVRVHLPISADEHMPPEGKPGLTTDEIDVLAYWIEKGALNDQKIDSLLDNPTIGNTIVGLLPAIRKNQQRMIVEKETFEKVHKELSAIAAKLGIDILPDKASDQLTFALRMNFPPKPFSTKELLTLAPYFAYFSSVSLAASDISDDELFYIAKMENLQHLFIQKTSIVGSGLPYLHALPNLETLNISFTPMEAGNALHLLEFPVLKKIYFFGTPVKKDVIEALQAYRPDLEIILEEGPLF